MVVQNQRISVLKGVCLGILLQKIGLCYQIIVLLKKNGRHEHEELTLEYPNTEDGDKNYGQDQFVFGLQLCIGLTLLICAYCLVRKNSITCMYLLPCILTVALLAELPLKPVLPLEFMCIMPLVLLVQIYAILCATCCHAVFTIVCMSTTCAFIGYWVCQFVQSQLSYLSGLYMAVAFIQVVYIAKIMRKTQLEKVR